MSDSRLPSRRDSDCLRSALATVLAREDPDEEHAGLSPHDRLTCPLHRRWVHQCVSSPVHAIRVTGHRWCRACDTAVAIAVDELAESVNLTCPNCRQFPASAVNRQVLRSCRASIIGAQQNRFPLATVPRRRSVA